MTDTKENLPKNAEEKKKPTCIIVLGMAGSGKTTFVSKIVSRLYNNGQPYVINLDPACSEVPYPANIGKLNQALNLFNKFSDLFWYVKFF